MNTLTSQPVATLIQHLFTDAQSIDTNVRRTGSSMAPADLQAAMQSTTGYKEFYGRMKDAYLAVSPETGRMLYMLARSSRAKNIVEFGTSFGISTLHLAAALRDNGGGRLIGSEFEPTKAQKARENLRAGGLLDLVDVREGDALETLARDLPESIDLVLLDGAKGLYWKVLSLLESRLRPGALILADNADYCPDYLARVRDPQSGYVSAPISDDVEVSLRS